MNFPWVKFNVGSEIELNFELVQFCVGLNLRSSIALVQISCSLYFLVSTSGHSFGCLGRLRIWGESDGLNYELCVDGT